MQPTNIFATMSASASGEVCERLLSGSGFRLERIVSTGQATPEGQSYDQDADEWVLLITGAARLRFESPEEVVEMKPGDYVNIPAHRRHRVEWTDPERETVWLAVHYRAVQSAKCRWRLLRDCLAAGWNMIRMPGRSHRGPLPPADEQLLQLAAALRRNVTHLAEEIGERNVLHRPRELAQAADFVESELVRAGYHVARQEYEVSGTTCCNLEAEIPGWVRPGQIVVIGAHYDSVPGSPAANDNGSGVAALLSLAEKFSASRNDRTLRFVAFVNEEAPFAHTRQMGSSVYARRCRQRGEQVTAMLSLETIGCYSDARGSQKYPPPIGLLYPSRGNFIAFVGNTRYGGLVRHVVAAFRQSEHFPSMGAALPESVSSIGRSDHWSFWQEGYPALMVTDTAPFRYRHYHTPEDTVDKIDFERMARVVRGLQGVISSLVTV